MKTFVKIPTLIFISIILVTYIFLNDKAMLNYKEDVIFQNQLKDSTKGKSNYGKNGRISEYMRFYQLNPDTHYSCQSNIIRPSPADVTWRKDTYQQFKLQFKEYPENDVFVMKFYFDDRFMPATGERHIRAFVTVHGPGHLKNAKESKPVAEWLGSMRGSPWYVLLWYDDFENPVGVTCKDQPAAGLNRNVSNTYFFQDLVTCIIPEINILPKRASIVGHPCAKPSTYIDIVYPKPLEDPTTRMIGVCMASLYGNMSVQNVPYFVNWMETLYKLGVSEVSINNATLRFEDDMIKKAFQYYQDIGRLTFTHYPVVHETWDSPKQDDAATEAINKLTTGDCLYTNLKRYWYVLIIDMDEVPVPAHFDTYQEYIDDYTRKYDNLTHAHCLTVRSSFFYQELPPGNPEYPSHLPVLRQTRRFRVEPIEVDGVGISKSFHNMRNLVAAGHHITRQTHWGGGSKNVIQQFMDPEDILIHHYRSNCKWSAACKDYWNNTIHDDILPRKYGKQLQANIERVLQTIHYKFT